MRKLQWIYKEKIKRNFNIMFFFLFALLLAGCSGQTENAAAQRPLVSESHEEREYDGEAAKGVSDRVFPRQENEEVNHAEEESGAVQTKAPAESQEVTGGETTEIIEIPAYFGQDYVEINGNIPFFDDSELSAESFEYYPELDLLGRCGVCMASVGQDIMPTEERGEIGSIKPSGWHTVKYPGIIDGNYLYNRCHLIGYQLTGENANTKNLITGTRYMNTEGMLPFENRVADYVEETGNHVMYRVTPVFEGKNLLAKGVVIEAKSVEDNGAGILFNVFCYNVQPGIIIDYANGDSMADESAGAKESGQPPLEQEAASDRGMAQPEQSAGAEEPEEPSGVTQPEPEAVSDAAHSEPEPPSTEAGAYAVNSKNGKIHKTGECPATGEGDNAMKSPVYFGTYEEAEAYSLSIAPGQGKRKCGNCW